MYRGDFMKVSELEGAELDYWVVKALGIDKFCIVNGELRDCISDHNYPYKYSEWYSAGPIIM